MKKSFSIILITIGSFLEILFYVYRFKNDGLEIWLSIIIGVLLTLFLSLLMLKRDSKITWILICALAVYSVLATSAGQSFSLSELENKNITNTVQEENRAAQIEEYKHEIHLLDRELEKLSEQITVTTTSARRRYGEAVEAVQARQDAIRADKKIYQEQINALRAQQTMTAAHDKKSTNIYQFYNGLFGVNAGILQFILQTILSLFIAMAAPFAIILLTNKKPEKPEKRKYVRRNKPDYSEYIEKFVHYCWVPKKQKRSDKIVDKRQFVDWMRRRYKDKKEKILFTDYIFDKIKNVAIEKKVIDKNGIIINNDNEEKIISILKESLNNV